MRVGVDRAKHFIKLPLPPRIDPSVTMMQVEEKPDVTYDDVGGAKVCTFPLHCLCLSVAVDLLWIAFAGINR